MTTEGSFTEDTASQMLKELQSWWEVPSMAQYISLFREPFNLPEIEIEELEQGFIDDTIKGPNTWLQNLILAFLKSILPGRGVNAENWELHLRKLVKRKWPAEEQNPFEEDVSFHQLKLRAKVIIIYSLCLYRLDRNDIVELMKSMDAEALRVQKLGVDDIGNTYWYFYGTRLYKEEAEEKKSWDEEWKQQKKKSFRNRKRRRGRPRKRMPTSDGESDFEDMDSSKNDGYMNVNAKSRWSVVCDTIEEWVNFAEKFKSSKSANEKSLFKIIQENFLPTLNKIYEEKEKKLQQKIKELMPVREKIVTRRETRRLRGEDVDKPIVNGYDSDDMNKYYPVNNVKDRARRLEERNKRASEYMQAIANKKAKRDSSQNEYDSPNSQRSDSSSSGDDLQSEMEKLLTSVKLHKDAWPFLYPVNEEDAPGYYEIIKDPIDLTVIENRLFEGEYETVGDLDADFSKMVSNCELYNGEFHDYSKMAQMLRIAFRKGVAKILDSLKANESQSGESEGSSDSRYHSNSNSVSPPPEPPVEVSSHVRKKSKERRKRKKRPADALDLLAHASEIAVQNSNSNDMLNVSNMYDELKKSSEFSNLKILPIHSHPQSIIEKLSSNASVEPVEEIVELDLPYQNQGTDMNGQFVRASPTNSIASTSSDPAGYMNNLTHLSNFIDKNGVKKLNLLTNSDVTSVLSDRGSSHHENNSSPVNGSSDYPKGPVNPDNLQGFVNILDEYNENFLSHLMKQPTYASENPVTAQSKDNSTFVDTLPKQDMTFNKNMRKSPPTSNFLGQDNTNMHQHDVGNPLNITTVDTSALGITFNPFSKSPTYPNVPVTQNEGHFASDENVVPTLSQEGVPSKNSHLYKPKPRTLPNESHQYYEPPNVVNGEQTFAMPNMSYPPVNLGHPNSNTGMPTTSVQTVTTSTSTSNGFVFNNSSTSNIPLQIPAVYPKSAHPKPRMQMEQQHSNLLQASTSQPNGHFMFVPNDFNKGPALPYHVYNTQTKPSQNIVEERANNLPNGTVASSHMENIEKRMINNQENVVNRTSPPQKKSPVPQQTTPPVPSTNMPYIPSSTSTSTSTSSRMPLPVTSSNFIPMNNFTQGTPRQRPVIIRTKAPEKKKPVETVTTTSFNTISSSNSKNVVPQNTIHQSPNNTKTLPVVFSYNNTSPSIQNDLRFKNNPAHVASVQSSICMPNSLPVVQQVIIPAGSQQIQMQNSGRFVFASPQNTVRLFNKEQNVQVLNNAGQVNQGYAKVVPQFLATSPVLQVSKDVMSGLQFQAVSQSNNQAYTQVTQSPQFVNIPTYMLTNQNGVGDASQQSVMNLQPFQLSPRQMHIGGQGNV